MAEERTQDPALETDKNQTPPGENGEEEPKLLKYKTIEEANRGIEEANRLVQEQGRKANEAERQLAELQNKIDKANEADTVKQKEKANRELLLKRQQINSYLVKEMRNNPAGTIEKAVKDMGFATVDDIKEILNQRVLSPIQKANQDAEALRGIRATDPIAFDKLQDEINKKLDTLPEKLRRDPEVIGLVFDNLKNTLPPEQRAQNLINEKRSNINLQDTTPPPTDKTKNENQKAVDRAVEAYRKSKM